MKTTKLLMFTLPIVALSSFSHGGAEVDRVLAEYSKIETVTCKIRRTKEGAAGKMRFLSRVYWTDTNQLHAEKLTPVKQRTIVDGKTLYQYTDGSNDKGFSRPIEDLSEQMKISLQYVPGTAMDHLLWLKDREETVLPPAEGADKRIGIQTDNKYVVLLFDGKDRLTGVDFYKTSELKERFADYNYQNFTEVMAGTWIPFEHTAELNNEKVQFKESVKIDSFIANKPIAESLFIPSNFFDKNIDFVDDFAKIFPE